MAHNIDYLGDGVYAEYDGFGTWLKANNHVHPTDKIYLEPDVFKALVNFVNKNQKKRGINETKHRL